ncbi:MAG: DUF362 domain-containing protein [Anaerolineales bacterium]|nr:DUF362 domain-containing protein [Anaerolineales bacterium]
MKSLPEHNRDILQRVTCRTQEVPANASPGIHRWSDSLYHWITRNILIVGPISLIWLLFRSGGKPSRLQYPCQQMAAAQSTLFLGLLFQKIPLPNRISRIPTIALRVLLIGLSLLLINLGTIDALSASSSPVDTNHAAIGTADAQSSKVVRVHSSKSNDWDFSSGTYYDHIDQDEVQRMLDRAVIELTGQPTTRSAWQSIMVGFVSGDKIAIKINNNNARDDGRGELNTNQQIIIAVISGLKDIGATESDISVYDVSRQVIPRQRDPILASYPNVWVIHSGNVTWDSQPFTGSFGSVKLPTALTEADHLINIHLMKLHSLASLTGALKNHFGTTSSPSAFHNNIHDTISELNSNPHIRGKIRLNISEAIYGAFSQGSKPQRFSNTDLFPEGTPNSLFLSVDPVAIDSVMYDHFDLERNGNVGPDTFLHVAATAGLGVHEHGSPVTGSYTPLDLSYSSIDYVNVSLDQEPTLTFADVPFDHWAHDYVETLYQNGFIAGCSAEPLLYCPEATMTRAESSVYVERGIHGADYLPNEPVVQIFDDVQLHEWFAKWADALWTDGYTAGCNAVPLRFCPVGAHNRAESTVFFLRMLNGSDFVPPEPTEQIYLDVSIRFWYSKWVTAAHEAGLIQPCEDNSNRGDSFFRPFDGLTRAEAACMMIQAKGLSPP